MGALEAEICRLQSQLVAQEQQIRGLRHQMRVLRDKFVHVTEEKKVLRQVIEVLPMNLSVRRLEDDTGPTNWSCMLSSTRGDDFDISGPHEGRILWHDVLHSWSKTHLPRMQLKVLKCEFKRPISLGEGFIGGIHYKGTLVHEGRGSVVFQRKDGPIAEAICLRLDKRHVVWAMHHNTRALPTSPKNGCALFVSTMSHEMRTPLNGIVGMMDVLRDTTLSSEQEQCVDMIGESSKILLGLVKDVLDFSRLEAGQLLLEKQSFSIRKCIESCIDVAALLIERNPEKSNVELVSFIENNVPATASGDMRRIQQVLVNLLANAIKFTERGDVTCRVRVDKSENLGSILEITVEDTGIGIPEHLLPNIFQPFFQIPGATCPTERGSGLGLAICSRTVQAMGGKIIVHSELNRGSVFVVSLPVLEAEGDLETSVERTLTPVSAHLLPLHSKRALVLLSNESLRESLQYELSQLGITSVGRATVAEAHAEIIRGEPFHIVFIGIRVVEDQAAAREIQQALGNEHRIPIVGVAFVSVRRHAMSRNAESVEVEDDVFDEWLLKPIKRNALLGALARSWNIQCDVFTSPSATDRCSNSSNGADEILRSKRILVVDDNAINRKVATCLLERLGCTAVEAVTNGAEALDVLKREIRPDVVLLDLQMPVMDGWDVCREVHHHSSTFGHPYIIALTADVVQGTQQRCIEAGMNDYLAKPIQLDVLHQKLRKALG